MRVCPIHSVQPYVPLPAPLYVLMNSNEKFLAIKGPLDFLTPAEITRLRSFDVFFYPPFISKALPFRSVARSVSHLMEGSRSGEGIRPSPFELSDAFLRMTASLWSEHSTVDPFFITVFAGELCGALPSDRAVRARELNTERYDQAVLKSSWAVWQALHLGYLDREWLTHFRDAVFGAVGVGEVYSGPGVDADWLGVLLHQELELVPCSLLQLSVGMVRQKLESRALRLESELICEGQSSPSIRGSKGLQEEVA